MTFCLSSRRLETCVALVTGVQTCALPFSAQTRAAARLHDDEGPQQTIGSSAFYAAIANQTVLIVEPVEMTARRCDVARRQFCFRQHLRERRQLVKFDAHSDHVVARCSYHGRVAFTFRRQNSSEEHTSELQ